MATYGLTLGRAGAEGRSRRTTSGDEDDDDAVSGVLPPLAEGDVLELKPLRPEQKFTQPPPRFSEATLVKELEENGIGRPSTYASIIGVLQDRDYAHKVEGRFKPIGARHDDHRAARPRASTTSSTSSTRAASRTTSTRSSRARPTT